MTDNPLSRPKETTTETKRQATLTPFAHVAGKATETSDRPETKRMTPPTDVTRYNYDDHWEEFTIDLKRVTNHAKLAENFFNFDRKFSLGRQFRSGIFYCWRK